MVILDENKILPNLNALIEIEVEELIKYSATPVCDRAKYGKEDEYNHCKKKADLLADAKNYILFSIVFPYFPRSSQKGELKTKK